MIVARWKLPGLYKADAGKVANEILSIGPGATPEQIVEKARGRNTELHKCFTWNDRVAAERWRIQQARHIVCHLVVRDTQEPDKDPVRIFFKAEGGDGYKPTEIILKNEDEYLSLLRRALADLRAYERKYTMLSDRIGVAKLVSSLEAELRAETETRTAAPEAAGSRPETTA